MVKFDLRFTNPIFTIIAGIIIAFTLMFIPYLGYVIGPLIGGFIAIYYAKEKKIIYSVFVGIGATIVLFIYSESGPINYTDILEYLVVAIFLFILPAIIGGFIGRKIDNSSTGITKTSADNIQTINMREIIKDSVRYPLSYWKSFLIFGIIAVISNILSSVTLLGATNIIIINLLAIIGFLIAFLTKGYIIRIVKSSLIGVAELPEFNNWIDMFKDGIKMFIVGTVYAIPAILLIFAASPSLALGIIFGTNFNGFASLLNSPTGYLSLIAILYMIIVIPILLMAITNMANNNSKLSTAFQLNTIRDKITSIGWKKFITWYLMTGIVLLILTSVGVIILVSLMALIRIVTLHIVGIMIASLILIPYLGMYIYRSVALFYMSE
jgi:hypothetical protein